MRKALMLACASALVLSACQPAAEDSTSDRASDEAAAVNIVEPAPAADAAAASRSETPPPPKLQVRAPAPTQDAIAPQPLEARPADVSAGPESEPARSAPTPAPLAPIARIAYAFSYVMSAPKDRGAELMSRHEYACVLAGAGYCQVVTAQADWTSRVIGT